MSQQWTAAQNAILTAIGDEAYRYGALFNPSTIGLAFSTSSTKGDPMASWNKRRLGAVSSIRKTYLKDTTQTPPVGDARYVAAAAVFGFQDAIVDQFNSRFNDGYVYTHPKPGATQAEINATGLRQQAILAIPAIIVAPLIPFNQQPAPAAHSQVTASTQPTPSQPSVVGSSNQQSIPSQASIVPDNYPQSIHSQPLVVPAHLTQSIHSQPQIIHASSEQSIDSQPSISTSTTTQQPTASQPLEMASSPSEQPAATGATSAPNPAPQQSTTSSPSITSTYLPPTQPANSQSTPAPTQPQAPNYARMLSNAERRFLRRRGDPSPQTTASASVSSSTSAPTTSPSTLPTTFTPAQLQVPTPSNLPGTYDVNASSPWRHMSHAEVVHMFAQLDARCLECGTNCSMMCYWRRHQWDEDRYAQKYNQRWNPQDEGW